MKHWYVVQVYAGYEKNIKSDILKSVEEAGLNSSFGDVLIPAAKMRQFFNAGDSMQDQQLFPGYLLVEMENIPELIRLVLTRPRVMRFLGGAEPVALSSQEVQRIQAQMRGDISVAVKKHELEIGKEVEIKEGPFAGFVGIVDKIDEDNETLTLMVSIFGRMTPVELGFSQVKH